MLVVCFASLGPKFERDGLCMDFYFTNALNPSLFSIKLFLNSIKVFSPLPTLKNTALMKIRQGFFGNEKDPFFEITRNSTTFFQTPTYGLSQMRLV